MKKLEFIKRFKYWKKQIYEIKDRIKKSGNKKLELNKKGRIKIREIEGNIIGIEFLKPQNIKNDYLNLELKILDELEEDNNIYIINFSNLDNPVLINKNFIIENIDKNLFKYFKDRNEFASRIHLTIFNYKKLINSDYFGRLLFTETPLSFLFLDIYDKQINDENEFEVEYIIQSIPIDEKIPVKLIFKLDEKEKDNIKLDFRMDYYDNRMSRNVIVSKVRDLLKKEMFEKMDFELDLSGYYILDKENFKIKEIKAEQNEPTGKGKNPKRHSLNTNKEIKVNRKSLKPKKGETYNKFFERIRGEYKVENLKSIAKDTVKNLSSVILEKTVDKVMVDYNSFIPTEARYNQSIDYFNKVYYIEDYTKK